MTAQKEFSKAVQSAKMSAMYREYKQWKSHLQLVHDELTFIEHLLNSYVFEPNTPNLFERLQDYLGRIRKTKVNRRVVSGKIIEHEKKIGGMIDCSDTYCDSFHTLKHETLKS